MMIDDGYTSSTNHLSLVLVILTLTSVNTHVHMDVVIGYQHKNWTLYDMEMEVIKADLRQLNYFIDDELFKIKPVITTPIADYAYQRDERKLHLAYDVVPADRHVTDEHYDFYWNRTKKGKVLAVVNDERERGYGNYVLIGYEA